MDKTLSRDYLMSEIESSWNELQAFIASLTEAQLTQPSDTAGWTVKDHLIHLAAWEAAALARIEGKSKREILDINPEIWKQGDDPINAVIQQRYCEMPLNEVLETLNKNHENILAKLDTMSEEDLLLPYKHYQPKSSEESPIIEWVMWDTAHHYQEHIPWMTKIAEKR